jgi:hypothetical protein
VPYEGLFAVPTTKGGTMVEVKQVGLWRPITAVAILVAALAFAAPTSFAAAPAASCMGQEASGVSPPGSSDEAPGGMKDLTAFFKANSSPPGAAYRSIASLHEGSHEACDEALEG